MSIYSLRIADRQVHGRSNCIISQHHVCGLQANQIGHIVCGSCRTTLMYAFGAASVKCQVCNAVTPANQSTVTHHPGPSHSNSGSGAASSRPQESQQTVVVVNPPTLDAEGNEVRLRAFALQQLLLCNRCAVLRVSCGFGAAVDVKSQRPAIKLGILLILIAPAVFDRVLHNSMEAY